MAGQHLQDLRHRVSGMARTDVSTSKVAWEANAESLDTVEKSLTSAGNAMALGFGDTEIARTAKKAFDDAAAKVRVRRIEMTNASAALENVVDVMRAAENAANNAPAEPGAPPRIRPTNGDETDEITALKIYAGQMRLHNTRVEAYGDADANARAKVQALIDNYTDAVTILSRIEGKPEQGPGPGGQGPGNLPTPSVPVPSGPVGPLPTPTTPVPTNPHDPHIPVIPTPTDPHVPLPPETPGYQPDPPTPSTPGSPVDPGTGGPGGPAIPGPAVLGGIATAGLLGTPGVVNGIRGLLSRGGLGTSPGTIGSSGRVGGPGSLGRTGAATPGSPVSRGTSGRGAGGAGGGRGGRGGVAGNPGGRGGRGGGRGAGAAGAAGSGRGRGNKDREGGQDRDLFDDGQDWIDDEGTAPGVLD